VKLLVIDLVNYLISLLEQNDRSILIAEIHEMQQAIVDQSVFEKFASRKDDIEYSTLKEVNTQLNELNIK